MLPKPEKIVFLVDMNAFFISCETARRPELRGRPAAVAGDPSRRSGIILAASYEARAFGVKTTMPLYEALRLCPGLVLLPPDMRYYAAMSAGVMEILGDCTPVIEQNSIDEAWLDLTGTGLARPGCAAYAESLMERIERELGLWCSIGISENRFLSKMASEIKKPRGITELWLRDVPQKLWPLPAGEMYGVGRQTTKKLELLGVHTIGELAALPAGILARRFGKYGALLHELANGNDRSKVTPHQKGEAKSIGRSTTLPEDLVGMEPAKLTLMALAEEVGYDARRQGKKGTTVQITIKYSDFQVATRQKTLPPTNLTKTVYRAGTELLEANWNARTPIRLLGISLSGFEENESAQLSFFEQKEKETPGREEIIEQTLDSLRGRYGRQSVRRAALLKQKKPEKPEKTE